MSLINVMPLMYPDFLLILQYMNPFENEVHMDSIGLNMETPVMCNTVNGDTDNLGGDDPGNSVGDDPSNLGGNDPSSSGGGDPSNSEGGNSNDTPDVLTDKLTSQWDNHSRGHNRRLTMSNKNWDSYSKLDTRELREDLAYRVNSSHSLKGQYYVRTVKNGEHIVCRLGNNRESTITKDILKAVRNVRSNGTGNVLHSRPNGTGYVMQQGPKAAPQLYSSLNPEPDTTVRDPELIPNPTDPINYIRRRP